MIYVKVTCQSGNYWVTRINLNFCDAYSYFMNSVKNYIIETEDEQEFKDPIISVEQLD